MPLCLPNSRDRLPESAANVPAHWGIDSPARQRHFLHRPLYAGWTTLTRLSASAGNILRSDSIANLDIGFIKDTRIKESHVLQFRAEFYNSPNTRNFGIPEAPVSSTNFLNQRGQDGGNRGIVLGFEYTF